MTSRLGLKNPVSRAFLIAVVACMTCMCLFEAISFTWMSRWKLGSMVSKFVISPTYKRDILGL